MTPPVTNLTQARGKRCCNKNIAHVWLQSTPTKSEGEISLTQDSTPAKNRRDLEVMFNDNYNLYKINDA